MTPEPKKNNNLLSEVIEVVSREGFDGMAQAFSILFNEAMHRELLWSL